MLIENMTVENLANVILENIRSLGIIPKFMVPRTRVRRVGYNWRK